MEVFKKRTVNQCCFCYGVENGIFTSLPLIMHSELSFLAKMKLKQILRV